MTNDFIKSTSQKFMKIRIVSHKTRSTMTLMKSNITHNSICSKSYQSNCAIKVKVGEWT
jgi:hypothetical protein